MIDSLVWLLLLPLAWATLAFVLGPGRGAWLAIAGLAAQFALAVDLARKVAAGGVSAHVVGGWGAPLGIDLAADGLSAAMLLLTQGVALPLAIHARAYFKAGDPAGVWFWPLLGFLLAGLNALFVSADLFNLYVTLELVGLAACRPGRGGWRHPAGGGRLALPVRHTARLRGLPARRGAALWRLRHGFQRHAAAAGDRRGAAAGVDRGRADGDRAAAQDGALPLPFLAPAGPRRAPAPVSALLSALVVKASFYLILRLWLGPSQALLPKSFALGCWRCSAPQRSSGVRGRRSAPSR